ncbi:iron-siderophore ABC transporter substrate-binding protein [Nocardioides campestrisoli]|uniref:iron-siderophore ABC transporter substrate-binding protein n=1 Tax=Nocardioides campestrisoli TaxID=2736757 RepID=UPI0015E6E8D8|nr:iron-siderophore ABC transporter substrate-binding protein [Nocardioides campestrisoli]
MRRTATKLVTALAGLSLLTACSTGSTETAEETSGSTTSVEEGAFPVTIEHAFGETTIESEPKRVATLGWTDQDNALALGVVPVGATKISWGGNDQGSTDWFDAELEEVGGEAPVRYDDSAGAPIQEIAETAPDLILATNSGITEAEYKKLSKIAPVVPYPEAPFVTPWETQVELAGEALGRSELAAEVIEETTSTIEEAKAEHPDLQGTSFIFAYFTPTKLSSVSVYSNEDPRVAILERFGLVTADVVESTVEKGKFYGDVPAEEAETLDSDLLLTYVETEDELETYQKDKLLGRIPALAAGHVYAEVDKHLGLSITNPTPISIPFIVENYLPKVAEAAAGANGS